MTDYLIGPGRAPTGQGQAACVRSRPSAGMLAEVSEAVKDARLVGWDLSEVAELEISALEQLDELAQKCNTLVVVLAAQPQITRQLLSRPLTNVLLGGYSGN